MKEIIINEEGKKVCKECGANWAVICRCEVANFRTSEESAWQNE